MKRKKFLDSSFAAILLSVLIGFVVGAIIMAVAGYNPVAAYIAMFKGIFSRPKYVTQMIIRSTPLIFTGISVAFAFRVGLFNIGAEGQYIVGAMTAALVGFKLSLPPVIHFFVVIFAAMAASAVWGGFVGLLKAKVGIHEVISCIMLNWIALYLNNFLITLPGIKKPNTEASYEALETAWSVFLQNWKFSDNGRAFLADHPVLGDILLKTDLNYGIFIAVVVAVIAWFILNKTARGYELRAVGYNPNGARFAGIDVQKNVILSMAIAGAIAGLAGALQITGTVPHRISTLSAMENYGFDGISVALIAGLNPLGCVLSGLLFGGLKYGGASIQSEIGAPSEIINIMIGTIVYFMAISNVVKIIARKFKKKAGTGI